MKGFFHLSQVQKERPDAGLIPKCGSCGLYKKCQTPKMVPYGKGRSGVLVIGEAPGEQEDEEGRPFIGKAGQFLRQCLNGVGVNLDLDAVTTNALICRPPGNKIQDPQAIAYCHPNLSRTIRETQPQVILTLGRSALVSALSPFWKGEVGPLEKWVGWRIPLGEYWLCPTWHPSFLLRMKSELMDRQFSDHLEEAFQIEEPPPAREDLPKQVQILYDEGEICSRIKRMEEKGGWVAIDYETNCLKPEYEKARIHSCALSNGEETIAYPWSGKAIQATAQFLVNPHLQKIASNLKFEERWSRLHVIHGGGGVKNWGWDTMIATHCLDNRPGICSLKFQAFVHLGLESYNVNIDPYLSEDRGSHYNRIQDIALEDLLLYNGMDAILEHRLAMHQRKEMGYEE